MGTFALLVCPAYVITTSFGVTASFSGFMLRIAPKGLYYCFDDYSSHHYHYSYRHYYHHYIDLPPGSTAVPLVLPIIIISRAIYT